MTSTLQVVAVFNKSDPVVVAVKVLEGILMRQMTVCMGDTLLGTVAELTDSKQKEVLQGVPGDKTYAIKIDQENIEISDDRVFMGARLTATL
jgi:translation initiation factor IF-2